MKYGEEGRVGEVEIGDGGWRKQGGDMEDGEMWEGGGIWQWRRWRVGGVSRTGSSSAPKSPKGRA